MSIFFVGNASAVGFEGVREINQGEVRNFHGTKCVMNKTEEINGGTEWDTNKDGLTFNPLFQNIDLTWEMNDPTCITYTLVTGVSVFAAGLAADSACSNGASGKLLKFFSAGWINFSTLVQMSFNAGICVANTSNTACCVAAVAQGVAVSSAVGSLAIIYGVADGAFKKARICGHNWNSWAEVDGNGKEKSGTEWWERGAKEGSYQKCLIDLFSNGISDPSCESCKEGSSAREGSLKTNKLTYGCVDEKYDDDGGQPDDKTMKNKAFREYIYGGIEYEFTGCKVPANWKDADLDKFLGYHENVYDNTGGAETYQRYYMKGYNLAPNYACYRYKTKDETPEELAAYECCRRAASETTCIENAPNVAWNTKYHYNFCTVGKTCSVNGVSFTPYESREDSDYICAQTYALCPYNHNIGGGTEVKVFEDPNTGLYGKTANFCQYRYHCLKKSIEPFIARSNFTSGFIDSSCRDMKGDSQNQYKFNSDLLPMLTSYRFSAPIIQCFKETMQNVFFNRYGESRCVEENEKPINGVCESGQYQYKKGDSLPTESFFAKMQRNLQTFIKFALILAVTVLGGMTLLATPKVLTKKDLVPFIFKIGIVLYFVSGTAWQDFFFKGVIDSSLLLSDITIGQMYDEGASSNKLDGCQFPRYDENNDGLSGKAYPVGKEYLKVWDTLDCKIALAIGFGPGVNVPNLILMILSGFITSGLGIVFVVGAFSFAFYLIFLTVRAIHIFIMSMISIILLIYVSPITITAALFARTKGIFEAWWKKLLIFSLQPMILFAYLGILIALFDNLMIGDVTFKGNGIDGPKTIVCNAKTKDTSIYCIFKVADIKSWNGLAPIGVGLPVLFGMNKTKIATITKAAIIMFIFSAFLDKISELSSTLIGGALPKGPGSFSGGVKSVAGALKGVQSRVKRGIKKHGGTAARAIGNTEVGRAAKGAISGKINSAKERVGNKISSAKESVSSAKKSMGNRASSAKESIKGKLGLGKKK